MIAVYMATYNGAQYIKAQLNSIYNQTLSPDEVIISDDNSTDNTCEIVKEFIVSRNLGDTWYVIKNVKRFGYPRNFYEGIKICNCEFIFFADQDDIWEPQKLEIMYAQIEQHVNINLLACGYDAIDACDKKIFSLLIPHFISDNKIKKINTSDILYMCRWAGMAMVVRKSWAMEYIDVIVSSHVPHDFLLSMLASLTGTFYELGFIGVHHRRHNNNTAKEEHRITKLVNRCRLLQELEDYIQMIHEVNDIIPGIFYNQKLLVIKKEEQMRKRYEFLLMRDILGYLMFACTNWASLRMFSVIRDIFTILLGNSTKGA